MTPEESAELRQLVDFLKENDIGEFEFERSGTKIRICFGSHGPAVSAAELTRLSDVLAARGAEARPAAAPAPQPGSAAGPEDADAGLHMVKSPIVGTFYESPSPGATAFVKIGDQVESGQILCIIEAMKLMNEIESDAAGEVVKRLVSSGQPVEYGQPLFALRLR